MASALIATLLTALPIAVASFAAGLDSDTRITILRPLNEETIHDNTRLVPVTVAVEPGGTVRLLLDGIPSGAEQRGGTFTLQNVERGTHTLEAQLVDSAGNIVARSATVTFYMWQASALAPGRGKKP